MHLLLVCEEDKLTKIVGKLKAVSGKNRNIEKGITTRGHVPLSDSVATTEEKEIENAIPLSDIDEEKEKKKYNALWTQKFGKSEIKDENYLNNVIEYIRDNRIKHELPESKELEKIKKEFLCSKEHANRTEYNGGFDVVIGNPPYVRQELLSKNDKDWFVKNYEAGNGTADLYVYFYEKSISILSKNGLLGFITPNKFYKTKYGKELRIFLKKQRIIELIDFFELKVFEDASTDSQILILKKENKASDFNYAPIKELENFRDSLYNYIEINPDNLDDEIWVFNNYNELKILNKLKHNSVFLKDYTNNGIEYGIKTGLNEAFIIDEETKNKIILEDPKSNELIKPYVSATDIDRYVLQNANSYYFINTYYDLDISKYKGVYNWLLNFDEKLQKRQDKGNHHFNLRACKYYEKFDSPKIIYIHTAVNHKFYYDEEGYYINNSCYLISNADKFLSVWLNSKVFSFYKKLNFVAYGDSSGSGRAKLDYNKMVNVPIPNLLPNQKQPFIEKANQMLSLNKDLQQKKSKFLHRIKDNLGATAPDNGACPIDLKLSKKLEVFYNYDFKIFVSELKKKKVVLSLLQQDEWEEYFNSYKTEINQLQAEINKTDKEIDQMVYELYGLTEDEIKIVEKATA